MTVRRSLMGTEWERVHAGLYEQGTRTITRLSSHRWELAGMVIDTTEHRTLREAMDTSDQT